GEVVSVRSRFGIEWAHGPMAGAIAEACAVLAARGLSSANAYPPPARQNHASVDLRHNDS
ncbi:MAG TPA: hypothetical protein VN680_12015, partial [Burkholderiaceae bacterium]|nr:hypothetical protein [Burkholderiaceae bacterium]